MIIRWCTYIAYIYASNIIKDVELIFLYYFTCEYNLNATRRKTLILFLRQRQSL